MVSRLVLFALCYTLITLPAKAQQTGDEWSIGGNVSVGTSWIINQNAYELFRVTCEDEGLWGSEPDYKITVGYGVGVTAVYQSGEFWGFAAELNYARAGQNYSDGFTTTFCPEHSEFERRFALHYLQIPLMAKFTNAYRSDVKWYVTTGPQLGLLLGARETVTIGGEKQPAELFTPAKKKVKTFDLDFVIGAGVDISLTSSLYLQVGFRAYIGLTDINGKAVEDFISSNDASYQASRNFSAGLQFGIHYVIDWVGAFYR